MGKFGAVAGVAAAAAGVFWTYETHVLHLHSTPGGFSQISISEVLGCKASSSQLPQSEMTMKRDSDPKCAPQYDGLNSYETLVLAPRY